MFSRPVSQSNRPTNQPNNPSQTHLFPPGEANLDGDIMRAAALPQVRVGRGQAVGRGQVARAQDADLFFGGVGLIGLVGSLVWGLG